MAGSIQLIYLIIKKILNIINGLNLNFCNSYLLKFPLKKEENSMKETNIIYDSVSNTWSIIVKVVNKSLLQIEYPELTGYKTKEDAEGSKIQNHFTAYLIQFVRGKRHDYLEKKIQMADAEELLEDIGQMEARIVIEELLENQTREQLLLQEAQGKYPEWNKMSDERLMKALHTLRDEERKLIYQHVFEERTFEEMSRLNGLSEERCKGIYYYAIRKIRKVMGGEN